MRVEENGRKLPEVVRHFTPTALAAFYPRGRKPWHGTNSRGLEGCKRGGEAVCARFLIGRVIPFAVLEFAAVDDAQVDGELARDPAKVFIFVTEERGKGEIADAVERMNCQFKEPLGAVRTRRRRTPVFSGSPTASRRILRSL